MKRLFIAIFLILLAIAICTLSSIKVEKSSLQMRNELNDIGNIIVAEESEKALQKLYDAEKLWKKTENLFSFIVDADKIEEMNVGFLLIKAHLKDGDTEHALEKLRECELLLGEISENEKLNIKNIM